MTTTRIKEKISALVRSQLPEFIQSDFPTFVSFIEAYYRFLEQDQGALELVQNARSYADIDTTTNDFVKYFLKNYAPSIPENALIDRRFLVKKINDLYEAKGSELSFDVLFRTLFNTSVEVKYPFDFVLRPSDGRWEQRASIRVRTVSGNRNDINKRFLTYQFSGLTYTTPILNVKNLTSELTEVFLDKNFLAPGYNIGDTVRVFDGSGNEVFVGIIEPTITGFSVLRPGSGFKVGQIYNVTSGTALGTIIKITGVNNTGGITNLKFLVYGYGFDVNETSVLLDFDPTKNVSELTDIFSDFTNGFIDSLSLQLIDPTFQDYFAEDYVPLGYTGDLLVDAITVTTVTNPVATIETKPPNIATISFSFGALGLYPGQFTAENGFLSEPDVRLQDSLLFQPFAYQTNTDIDISEFFDVVKKLIHPAGQNLFNNRTLTSNVDLLANVSLVAESNIFFEATSTFSLIEDFRILRIIGLKDDVSVDEVNILEIDKDFVNIVDVLDQNTFAFNTGNIEDSVNVVDEDEKSFSTEFSNTVEPVEIIDEISIQLNVFDETEASIDQPSVIYTVDLESFVTPIELIDLNYSDNQDSETIVDSVSLITYESFINKTDAIIDSDISGLLLNYAEAGYFEEIYVGETVI